MQKNDNVAGKGRPMGAKNHVCQNIKKMIEEALSEVGGKEYLKGQAIENPVAFMGLVGKILPKEVKAELTGADGEPLRIEHIEYTIVDPAVSSLS